MLRQTRLLLLLLLIVLSISVPGYQALSASSATGWSLIQSAGSTLSQDDEAPYVAGRLLVQFAPDTPDEEKAALHDRLGAEVIEEIPALDVQILRIPEEATNMVFAYQDEPLVNYAEPDYIATIPGFPDGPILSDDVLAVVGENMARRPNDPQYPDMWNLAKIRAEQGWDITTGTQEVIIAVIDTGADASHPDLQGKLVAAYDFVNGDADPADDQGHGTHVAGIAAAVTNNGIGIAGVAWEAKIMPVKALSATGAGAHSWIANAIVWATDHGADVINMSLGGPYTSATMQQAVDYAWNHGVVIVAAAGNANTSNPTYPATYENVIGVSATDLNDQKATFSNYGSYVSVASPGVSILSTVRGSGYQTWSGTSMATPHVSGLAALLKSLHPAWTNAQIRDAIEDSAEDLGTPGWDAIFGWGRIDIYAALNSGPPVPTSTPTTPPPTATPIPNPALPPGLEQELIDAINRERAKLDLPPFRRDERLIEAARRHSPDMANDHPDRCSHYGSDGSDPFIRIRDSGYPLASGSEVIACGYQTPDDAVRGWKASPSHWAILTNDNYVDIGCGGAQAWDGTRYWTCNPARPSDLAPSPTATQTPSVAPTPSESPPLPTPEPREYTQFLCYISRSRGPSPATPTPEPTATPSPAPTQTPSPPPVDDGSHTVHITPKPQDVGWVVSNEPSRNHFSDDDVYAGLHGGEVYIGAIQFDLSQIPSDAKINWARLTLTGQTRDFVGDRGSWSAALLTSDVDADWPNHGYLQIRDAPRDFLILPILSNSDLQRNRQNIFNLDDPVLQTLKSRLNGTQRVSFRIEGPSSGPNNLFSWDSGYGTGGLGKPPVLTINYTPGDEATPTPVLSPTLGPTATPTYSPTPSATATPTPSPTLQPSATPPNDDIEIVELTPREDSVGWVVSNEPRTNYFGDDDLYAGIHNGNIYLAGIQFDLLLLPASVEILEGELLLTGQTRQYLGGAGMWWVEMLTSDIDAGWPGHGYTDIANALAVGTLRDLDEGDFSLEPDQLDVYRVNRLGLTDTLRVELSARRRSTGYVSFRIVGPSSGDSNAFSWDSGYGNGGLGESPVLRVTYRDTGVPAPPPTPAPSATTTPPAGGSDTDALMRAINNERAMRGLSTLSVNSYLMDAAQVHSNDLANNNRWSHTGADGSTPQERMRRAGYPLGDGDEVLAANSTDIDTILDTWLRNPRHENILMNANYVDIGAGHAYRASSDYGDYWTVLVARPAE
ncbi:MAG: S8 family serine peptidase [Anaerolineae bacterium]